MTQRQWQEVFSIVRREQKELFSEYDAFPTERYNELNDILDQLYPIAYGNQTIEDTGLTPKEPR
jgi:hypothetical protein